MFVVCRFDDDDDAKILGVVLRTNNFVAKYENKNNKIIIGVDENRMNNFNNINKNMNE